MPRNSACESAGMDNGRTGKVRVIKSRCEARRLLTIYLSPAKRIRE